MESLDAGVSGVARRGRPVTSLRCRVVRHGETVAAGQAMNVAKRRALEILVQAEREIVGDRGFVECPGDGRMKANRV